MINLSDPSQQTCHACLSLPCTSTYRRNMAGVRGLCRATGMKDGNFGKLIVAVVKSFTQFVTGQLNPMGSAQMAARGIESTAAGDKEFNTNEVDYGMLDSLAKHDRRSAQARRLMPAAITFTNVA